MQGTPPFWQSTEEKKTRQRLFCTDARNTTILGVRKTTTTNTATWLHRDPEKGGGAIVGRPGVRVRDVHAPCVRSNQGSLDFGAVDPSAFLFFVPVCVFSGKPDLISQKVKVSGLPRIKSPRICLWLPRKRSPQ